MRGSSAEPGQVSRSVRQLVPSEGARCAVWFCAL